MVVCGVYGLIYLIWRDLTHSDFEETDKYDNYVAADTNLHFLKTGRPVAKSINAGWYKCRTIEGVPKEMFMIGYKMLYRGIYVIQNPLYEPDVFFRDWTIKSIQIVDWSINIKGELEVDYLFETITDAEMINSFIMTVLLEEFEEFEVADLLKPDEKSTASESNEDPFFDDNIRKFINFHRELPVGILVSFEEFENIVWLSTIKKYENRYIIEVQDFSRKEYKHLYLPDFFNPYIEEALNKYYETHESK